MPHLGREVRILEGTWPAPDRRRDERDHRVDVKGDNIWAFYNDLPPSLQIFGDTWPTPRSDRAADSVRAAKLLAVGAQAVAPWADRSLNAAPLAVRNSR